MTTRRFGMLELMTALAIAATLLAIALPTFARHQNRTKLAEAHINGPGLLDAIVDYLPSAADLPPRRVSSRDTRTRSSSANRPTMSHSPRWLSRS